MISLDQIKNFYPASMAKNAVFHKHILKEYVQLLTLDYLSTTEHLLLHRDTSRRIVHFAEFIRSL